MESIHTDKPTYYVCAQRLTQFEKDFAPVHLFLDEKVCCFDLFAVQNE